MKRKSFSIFFFLRKKKLLKNGQAPICMRITANHSMCDVQIKRSILIELWDQAKERSKGKGQDAYELNLYIESVRTRIYQIHRELEIDGKVISADTIKNKYYGIDTENKTLLQVFGEHNQEARLLIGKGYVEKTVQRFETTAIYISEFLRSEYNLSDIALKELDLAFIRRFDTFLKVSKSYAQNSAITRLKILKKITRIAFSNDWIGKDPFATYQFKFEETNPEFLTKEELNSIIQKEFSISRLEVASIYISSFDKLKKPLLFRRILWKDFYKFIRIFLYGVKQLCQIMLFRIFQRKN